MENVLFSELLFDYKPSKLLFNSVRLGTILHLKKKVGNFLMVINEPMDILLSPLPRKV